jgi:hypothetical protein
MTIAKSNIKLIPICPTNRSEIVDPFWLCFINGVSCDSYREYRNTQVTRYVDFVIAQLEHYESSTSLCEIIRESPSLKLLKHHKSITDMAIVLLTVMQNPAADCPVESMGRYQASTVSFLIISDCSLAVFDAAFGQE